VRKAGWGLAGLLFRLEHDGDDNHFLKALGKAVALLHGTPHADLLLQIFARMQQTSKLKDVADEPRLLALQEDRPMLDLIQKNF
jgi:hypothetical protein